MLIDDPVVLEPDPILDMIAGGVRAQRVREGVYEIGHFGASNWPPGYDNFPAVTAGPYGVADDVEQVIAANPEIMDADRKFVITVTRIVGAEEPPEGGWRWHKWGDYIGERIPTTEYLHDEPDIDEVIVFHIYEKVGGDG